MNYIELINQFWQLDEEYSFNGNETRLYFFLLKKSNSLRWKNPFTNSDAHTAMSVGVSINTLKSVRNKLQQVGLISFKPGGNGARNKCTYQIKVSIIDTLSDTIPDTLSDESLTPYPQNSDTIYKHKLKGKNKHKPSFEKEAKQAAAENENSGLENQETTDQANRQKKASHTRGAAGRKKTEKPEFTGPLIMPFESEAFADAWQRWVLHRKYTKEKPMSLELQQKQLMALAEFDEEFSINQIKLAITNDWQGLIFSSTKIDFEKHLKRKNGNQQQHNPNQQGRNGNSVDVEATVAMSRYLAEM